MARPSGSKDKIKRKPRKCRITDQMIGQKYNILYVISISEVGKSPRVNVKCDCGTIKTVRSMDVRSGKVASCGCYHKTEMSKRQTKPDNISAKRKFFNNYYFGAKRRNILFELTYDQILEICSKNCFYCNALPKRIVKATKSKITVNGIDRVNNELGYNLKNVVPCCGDCNYKKGYATVNIILKAAEFLNENT